MVRVRCLVLESYILMYLWPKIVNTTTYLINISPSGQMHTTLNQNGWMKIHFYNPNLVNFQKRHLNDVEVHIFFPFPNSYHHISNILKPFFKYGPWKNQFRYRNEFYKFEIFILSLKIFERLFLVWFFHLKHYGTSMCGGKKS